MKRLLLGGLLFSGVAFLSGCPIFPDSGGGTYYRCNGECCSNNDCNYGYVCGEGNYCVQPQPSEVDASIGPNPCGYCPSGTVCTLYNGSVACVASGDDGGTEDATASVDAGAPDAFPVADASRDAAVDSGMPRLACNADSTCGSAGSKCIDGFCVPRSQLCSDATQCKIAGESCVEGVCVPTCNAGEATPCPTGYQCDFGRGVCDINPDPCTISAQCQGRSVCVESRCVAPAGYDDAGGCPTGQVAVNGGCIPDQAAVFGCGNVGYQGALAGTCSANSICLRGDCYVTCTDADAGACGAGKICKAVTTTLAPGVSAYGICASPTTMGSECDPAAGLACDAADEVCIDGFCR